MRQRRDGRIFEYQLRPQLGTEPFLELDSEIDRCRRIEPELSKARIGPDCNRRVVDRLLQIGDAPVANIRFGEVGRRQTILLTKDARRRMRVRSRGRRSEEHTSELQSRRDLVCRLLLEKKK